GLTALTAEFTVGEGKLMTHDEPCSMAPDDKHDLISGTCSHLPKVYKKYGFEIEGTGKKYALRNGEYVDAYYMARVK
ncbi:hypothetical protein U9124_17630, partial [Escherichia coli]